MDFKGMTWAGDIYQKFEAMCLEVEEVMYEDSVKYVENQVEKVGVSVKKLYAEIIQDLLPISCVDPMKVAAGDLPLKPYTQTDINKKPKSSILDIHGEIEKKETEDEDISDPTAEEPSLNVPTDASRLSPLSPTVLGENARSDVCSTKSKKVGIYKRPIAIKRISKNNRPPKMSRAMTSLSGDRSSSFACEMRSNCMVASDGMKVTRSTESFARNDPGETATENTAFSDASIESFNPDQVLSAESVRQEKKDSESTNPASEKTLPIESLREKADHTECNSSCRGLPAKPFDEFRKDNSFSQIKSNIGSDTCEVESVGEEVIASYEDNFDIEVIETAEVLEPRGELFEPVEKSKLEESCVLVEGDKLHFVSQETKKHKSYKKKFREALSPKWRSTRKQDRYVSQYKDLNEEHDAGVVIPAPTMDSDRRKLPVHDSCESDWELL